MRQYNQYIIHKNKIPSDYRTGQPANAHDSAVWTDHETAARAAAFFGVGYGMGFVFTDADPFWFLDIDKCLVNGAWSPVALELCSLFAGCYIEISQSGTGLHIVGTGTVPAHGCRNKENSLEFYTSGRYMALGQSGQGDPMHDASAVLPVVVERYFQHQDEQADAGWQEGHELGWELPDDDELIARALRMGGASVVFGGRVSFADLWTANVEALGRAYPSEDRAFDASAADMALASKLAWLTGNDCSRIYRLMWRSGLVRDKWEKHKAYLIGFTIPRALVRDGSFYDPKYGKRHAEQQAIIKAIGEGGSELSLSPSLSLEEMLDRFVNVIEGKRVVDIQNPKCIMNADEFVNAYKSSKTRFEVPGEFKMDGTPKVKSMDTAKLWADDTRRRRVQSITFRPGAPLETEDPDGKRAVNTWRAIERQEPTKGDCELFTRHIEYLFGPDSERFLDWLAHIEQHPGVLPHTGWVHISPMHGTGRNWLSWVLALVWKGYVATSFDLAGTLKNGYNGALSCKLLAIVDEINEGGSGAKWENAEVLKSIVTPAYRPINPKYGYQRVEYNCCRWLIFSNHTSALPLTEGDRRFNVVMNNYPPMPEGYYKSLYGALRDEEFVASVAWMLRNREIGEFNPGAHAVLNEAKRDMVATSRTETDDVVNELIASHPSDVIANSTLAGMITGQPFGSKLTPHHRHVLERSGVRPYGNSVRVGNGRVRVSILRNYEIWKNATPEQIRAEMERGTMRNDV